MQKKRQTNGWENAMKNNEEERSEEESIEIKRKLEIYLTNETNLR